MSQGSIQLFCQDINFTHPQIEVVTSWIKETLKKEQQDWAYLNIIFCSDDYLLELNRQYLNHDYFTDIITFEYESDPLEGELFISLDRVKDNAKDRQIKWPIELHRVIIHGVLHLSGYDDKTDIDAAKMRQKEDDYLAALAAAKPALILDRF